MTWAPKYCPSGSANSLERQTRAYDGRKAAVPQQCEGQRTEPPMSLPMPNGVQPLASAALLLDDTLVVACSVEDERATTELVLARPGHYSLRLTDRQGIGNRDPIRHAIHLVEDNRPRVTVQPRPFSFPTTFSAGRDPPFGQPSREASHWRAGLGDRATSSTVIRGNGPIQRL